MAKVVGDIAIQVVADIAPLVAGLNRAQAAVTGFGKTAGFGAAGAARALGTGLAAIAVAASTAGVGIIALTRQAIESGGALHDAALKTGVHAAALQAMSQVANEAGVETDSLTSSLGKMQKSIVALRNGTGEQSKAFAALGIAMADLAGKSTDQQFAVIAEKIDGIRDPAEKTAAAMAIFGKSG
ncbi:MAG: hypothetical protein EBT13_18370, partial [Rhodobacteraceae bacterium]|nr:hypothetical protein [Paracoccaceae bacterium]